MISLRPFELKPPVCRSRRAPSISPLLPRHPTVRRSPVVREGRSATRYQPVSFPNSTTKLVPSTRSNIGFARVVIVPLQLFFGYGFLCTYGIDSTSCCILDYHSYTVRDSIYHQEKGPDWLQMEPTIVVLSFRFPGIKLSQSRQRIPSRKGATMIPGCLDVVRGDDRFEAPSSGAS